MSAGSLVQHPWSGHAPRPADVRAIRARSDGCYVALRDVYAGSWLGTFVRSAVMVTVYTILFAFATGALIVVAILLR
jgi:hypothetical protein